MRTQSLRSKILPLFVLLAAAVGLSGCFLAAAATGVAVGGIIYAQERDAGDAVEDTKIHASILEGLLQKDEALFRKVDVEVVEGRVLLTGSVPGPDDRVEAARIAWNVDDVKVVLNEVQVSDTSGVEDFARDAWITTQLRGKTLGDLEVTDLNYSFDTVNGTVYIMGIAQDQSELERVTTHARNIPGVVQVVSHAVMKDDAARRAN